MHPLLVTIVTSLSTLDPTPEDEDIKAGFPALFIFVGMFLVIVLLGFSLARHLRATETNRRAGVYPGSPPEDDDGDAGSPARTH